MVHSISVHMGVLVARLQDSLIRVLLVLSLIGIFVVVHGPTHLVSIFGFLLGRLQWRDAAHLNLPVSLQALIWLPPLLLIGALMLRNQGASVAAEQTHSRRDLLVGSAIGVVAVGIRVWPLLQDPWLKLYFDDGVYLGATWLMLQGAVPYRDFVLAHPPGALALLAPAALLIAPFSDNSTALFTARLTAILSDGATTGLVYLAARQLVRPSAALFAAAVYATDALVIHFARGVRLEPLQGPWLAAGVVLVLMTLNGRRAGMLAGVCLGLGITVKYTGALVPIAAAIVFLVERRWFALRDLLVGVTGTLCLVFAFAVLTSGDEVIRQTVLLQLLRSNEPGERWTFLLSDARTGLTAIALLGGVIALGSIAWRQRVASGWLFISLWLTLTLVLFAQGASFYDHYYDKLALPAAILAAALAGIFPTGKRKYSGVVAASILMLPLGIGQADHWMDVSRDPGARREVARVATLPHQSQLLDFLPIHNVLLGRPFAHPPGSPFILDTFLGTHYLQSSLNRRWSDATAQAAAAIQDAEYVVVDPWTGPLPGLHAAFAAQPLVDGSILRLFTRVDQPETIIEIGPDLQLLQRPVSRFEVRDGQTWLVQPLYWRASQTPAPDQALALHLFNQQGERVAQLDVPVSGGIDWKQDEVTAIEYRMPLPADLAPGTYRLGAILYSWTDGSIPHMQMAASGDVLQELDLLPVVVTAR